MRVDTYDGRDALDQPDVHHVLAHVAFDRGVRQDIDSAPLALLTTGSSITATFAARDGDQACGYGQLGRGRGGWEFEYVVMPRFSDHVGVGTQLGIAARDEIARRGGGAWVLWLSAPKPEDDVVAASVGLTFNRELFQLRVPLPRPEPVHIATRPFVVGQDNSAWLELNNRAFSWHPDQSEWTTAELEARFAEKWFDPKGFLVYEVDGRMLGFCWTKRHDEYDRPLGEIYVIAKDTAVAEPGVGKQLTLAGLAYLASSGLDEGMLYVDATNPKALDMYLGMDFVVHHVDRCYVAVTPTAAPTP